VSAVIFIVAVTSQDLHPIKTQLPVNIQLYQHPLQYVNCQTFLVNVLDWQPSHGDDTLSANIYIQTSVRPYTVKNQLSLVNNTRANSREQGWVSKMTPMFTAHEHG